MMRHCPVQAGSVEIGTNELRDEPPPTANESLICEIAQIPLRAPSQKQSIHIKPNLSSQVICGHAVETHKDCRFRSDPLRGGQSQP